MKSFVIVFRQNPQRALSDADLKRRTAETVEWARRVNAEGHRLDPRILGADTAFRGPDPAVSATAKVWPVTALLFLEAADLNDAVRVAEAHPALRYGADVEVRPWAPPVAPPAS